MEAFTISKQSHFRQMSDTLKTDRRLRPADLRDHTAQHSAATKKEDEEKEEEEEEKKEN